MDHFSVKMLTMPFIVIVFSRSLKDESNNEHGILRITGTKYESTSFVFG